MTLRTPLCDLLKIDYPILQSGMRRIAGPELAAQVSNAGGLGILAGLLAKGKDLREHADGRGIAAALALGASGVMLGTRFVATRESQAASFWKQAILEARGDQTAVTDAFTGLYARAIENRFAAEYEASRAPVLPSLLQSSAAHDVYAASAARGNREYFPIFAGQSSGLIRDLPGAAEVVASLVKETQSALSAAAQRAGLLAES